MNPMGTPSFDVGLIRLMGWSHNATPSVGASRRANHKEGSPVVRSTPPQGAALGIVVAADPIRATETSQPSGPRIGDSLDSVCQDPGGECATNAKVHEAHMVVSMGSDRPRVDARHLGIGRDGGPMQLPMEGEYQPDRHVRVGDHPMEIARVRLMAVDR